MPWIIVIVFSLTGYPSGKFYSQTHYPTGLACNTALTAAKIAGSGLSASCVEVDKL